MARPAKQNIFTHNASVSTRVHFLHVSTDKNRHEAWNCATCYININITLGLYIYRVTVFLMSSWRHFCYFSITVHVPAVQWECRTGTQRITALDGDTPEVWFINLLLTEQSNHQMSFHANQSFIIKYTWRPPSYWHTHVINIIWQSSVDNYLFVSKTKRPQDKVSFLVPASVLWNQTCSLSVTGMCFG